MISLDFGKKIPQKKKAANTHLPPIRQRFIGEIAIFIENAAWRLDSELEIICSSTSSNHKGGRYEKAANLLVGRKVVRVDISKPALDLVIEFDGKLFLRVFCDQTNEVDNHDNYSVHMVEGIYTIGTNSQVKYLKRKMG